MAKNGPAPVHVRAPRVKTPAQRQKALENIAGATVRLRQLQERQKLVRELRQRGFVGRTDADVINAFNEHQRIEEAKQWVRDVLATPTAGIIIQRWLKDRITMAAIHLKPLIEKFLRRDGSDGGKDNSKLREMVEAHLNPSKLAA